MNKMPMCRICLVENVRMYIVNDKDLQELYETLTDIKFITEDRRPMLTCFLCCTKLKQCCQLQRKCLEAEELFAQMMNEPNASVNRGQLEYSSGLTVTPVENISIVDVSHIESIAVKEEFPAVCERLDDVIEPEEEHQSDGTDLKLENVHVDYSEDDVPLTQFKIEVEVEQEIPRKKRRASDTTWAALVTKQKLHMREKNLEDVITKNQQKNEESDSKFSQNTQSDLSKLIPIFQKPLTNTAPRVNISVIDTTLDTNCCNNIKKRNVTKHIRIHTGEKPFKCDVCQRSYIRKSDLTQHIRIHADEKHLKCEVCQSCFSKKGHLNTHIRTHTGEKPYKCEECELCFNQKSHLTRHIRTHTGEKPYKCEECQLCFSQKVNLTRHFHSHTGEKPYKCEDCQLRFSLKTTLLGHIRTHTGEKPYKCEECQLCFSQEAALTRHIRTHTGVRPYKCKKCQLCFIQKSNLIRHIRTHSGETPYKFEEC